MPAISTARLQLVPISFEAFEAVYRHDRAKAETIVGAKFPDNWPNDSLLAEGFPYALDAGRSGHAVVGRLAGAPKRSRGR